MDIETKQKKLFEYAQKKYPSYTWMIKLLRTTEDIFVHFEGTTGVKSKFYKNRNITRRAMYFEVDVNDYLENLKKVIDNLYKNMKSKNIKTEILSEGESPNPNILYEYAKIGGIV